MTAVSYDKDLAPLRRQAKAKVDNRAERERQRRWITPGDGQQQEYVMTREEAFAIADDADPSDADYPQLAAERDAQAAVGVTKTLSDVGQEVRDIVAQRNGDDGAAIKKARRRAKLQIDAATTPADIEAAAAVDWSAL